MNILAEIVKNKKEEIAQHKRDLPIAELLEIALGQPQPPSFFKALRKDGCVQVIAEIKKASPSAGELRHDFDPIAIAKTYEDNGASAISVLTDEKYFKGKLQYLIEIHKRLKVPLLRKDFVLEPYQVFEAKAYGASAILLIMAVLSDDQAAELYSTAREQNLDCLVEVHNTDELERAMLLSPKVIGVNNRDLTTFNVDLATTRKLRELISNEIVLVSESGIQSRQDIEMLGKDGIDAVLIGSALMKQVDVGQALHEFIGVEKWSR